jgi:hypothetical protein
MLAMSVAVPDAPPAVEAVNMPLDCPGGIIRDPRTIKAALLVESVTIAFPGAAALRVTVQFVVAPLATVDGLQLKEVSCADALAVTVTVVCTDPL